MIAAAPRTAVASAKVERGTIMSMLRVGLQDGSTWAFDVPRFYLGGANRLVAALAQPAAQALDPGPAGRLSADRR